MKKTLFIMAASALLLGCSSNNAEVKADTLGGFGLACAGVK